MKNHALVMLLALSFVGCSPESANLESPGGPEDSAGEVEPIKLKMGGEWSDLSFSKTGAVMYAGQEFDTWRHGAGAPDADCSQIWIYPPSPQMGYVYGLYRDCDHGGVGGFVLDPTRGRVAAHRVTPRSRESQQVSGAAFFSPTEEFVVIPASGEVQERINIVELRSGRAVQVAVGDLTKSVCEIQGFSGVNWITTQTFFVDISIDSNPWGPQEDDSCSDSRQEYRKNRVLVDAVSFRTTQLAGVVLEDG